MIHIFVPEKHCAFQMTMHRERIGFNPLVPDAHYSERPDKQVSLQIKLIEAALQLNCGFLFFGTRGTNVLNGLATVEQYLSHSIPQGHFWPPQIY